MPFTITVGRPGDGKAIVIEPTREYLDVEELLRTLKHEFECEWHRVNDEIPTNGTLKLKGKLPGKDR